MIRQKINSLANPLVIFIYGAPGTGKSSTAVKLAENLEIKVVTGTDQIRDSLKPYLNNPFLQGPTCNCWQQIGQRTPENIINGYLEQSRLLKKSVLEILELARKRGENIILEGVHLLPDLYPELKSDLGFKFFHFLLSVEDINLHRRNIALKVLCRKGREENWSEEKIEEIREIQKFFLAKKPSYVHLINSDTLKGKVMEMLKIFEESL